MLTNPSESTEVTLPQLIEQFPARPFCSAWDKPAKKLELLTTFLWLRQLTPSLTLDVFLNRFASIADFDLINCKRPDDAISTFLPTGKKADGQHNWTTEQRLDITALYVEMVFEAERQGQPVPMSFTDFIRTDSLRTQFLAGAFGESTITKKKAKKATKVVVTTEHTVGLFDRCIYNNPDGRQFRGRLINVMPSLDTPTLGDFQADSGELSPSVLLMLLEKCQDDGPRQPLNDAGAVKPVIDSKQLRLTKQETLEVQRYLAAGAALGIVPVDQAIKTYEIPFADNKHIAVIEIVNQSPVYVDAHLSTAEGIKEGWSVAETPPRDNLGGEYLFDTDDGVFKLQIVLWKA